MIEIQTLEVSGIAPAMKALRLPYGKEPRTYRDFDTTPYWETGIANQDETLNEHILRNSYQIHVNKEDITLANRLVKSGDAHAKAIRGIIAYAEIEAPIYWWCELETHIVGHQRLSSASTMHIDCKGLKGEELQAAKAAIPMGKMLKKIDYFSYQCLRNIWKLRANHRLQEWHQFCDWIATLPFAEQLILV